MRLAGSKVARKLFADLLCGGRRTGSRIPHHGSRNAASGGPPVLNLPEMMPHVTEIVLGQRAQCDGVVRANPARHAGGSVRNAANHVRQMMVIGHPQIDQLTP